MSTTVHFTKMHGAGNDYIYVYTPHCPVPDPARASVEWSRPHFGIGSDGLILIGESRAEGADFSMRVFNSDGSEAMMCGNGARCAAKFVHDRGLSRKTELALDTLSGTRRVSLLLGKDGKAHSATVDMGEPRLSDRRQLATPDGSMRRGAVAGYDGTFVSMGNPHFVVFVPEVEDVDLEREGSALEKNPMFPERSNIEFATARGGGRIRARVWERGSGVTMACGTGACATAVAACLTGRAGRRSEIEMDGGTLSVEWRESDGHVMMTGPAASVYEGDIALP